MRLHGLTSHPFRSAAHGSESETAAPVYLDYQATTPLDPRVRSAMLPFLTEDFGNPHSIGHIYGWRAADAVRHARAQVAEFINADDDEVVFTSGATEACNLAIRGAATATATDSVSASLQIPESGLRRPLASDHMGLGRQGYGVSSTPHRYSGNGASRSTGDGRRSGKRRLGRYHSSRRNRRSDRLGSSRSCTPDTHASCVGYGGQ